MVFRLIGGLPNYISSLHFILCNMDSAHYKHLEHNILQMELIIFLHIILLFLLNFLDWWMSCSTQKMFWIRSYLIKYNLYKFPPSPGYFRIFHGSLSLSWRLHLGKERYSNISVMYACKIRLPFKVSLKVSWKEEMLFKDCIYSCFHLLVLLISLNTSLLWRISK